MMPSLNNILEVIVLKIENIPCSERPRERLKNVGVENLSNNTIVLDTKNTKRTTALMDSNNFAYPAYMYKLLENDLTVYSGETKEINIQFNQQYNAKYYNTKIVFNNFNLDNNSNKKTIFEVDV